MDQPPVIITRSPEHRLATITLNRPDKRNALNAELVAAIAAAHRELLADAHVRVIVLAGSGPAFCAGADLASIKALTTATHEQNLQDSRNLRNLLLQLYRSEKPTIAAIHGPALAGGAGLASACDFVLATPEATFGYTEVRIGFVAALVMVLLTRQIGERRARDLLLTGRILPAREALDLGLINAVVPEQRLDAEVTALAASLAKNSPAAMAATKKLIESCLAGPLEAAIEAAAHANASQRAHPECREGIAAFLEKRKPSWITDSKDRA